MKIIPILKVVGVILLGSFILGGIFTFAAGRYIRYEIDKFKIGDDTEIQGTLYVDGKISGDGSGLTGVNAAKLGGASISGPHGPGYYHLGAWGVGRTDRNAVLVNTAHRADIASNADNANKFGGYSNLCYCIYAAGDCKDSGWRCAKLGQEVNARCGNVGDNMDYYNIRFRLYRCD